MRRYNNYGSSSSGIGFTGLLQVVLIALKLLGKIEWSWIWVWAPTWISLIVYAVVFVALYVFYSKQDLHI